MIKYNLYLRNSQDKDLKMIKKDTGIDASEHIRRAIDSYIRRHKKFNLKVSTSKS